MIGLHVQCDERGCGRYCLIPQHDLAVFPAATVKLGRAGLLIEETEIPLPDGWAATGDDFGVRSVLCASHAAR